MDVPTSKNRNPYTTSRLRKNHQVQEMLVAEDVVWSMWKGGTVVDSEMNK
jgi:hypothetical protein